MIIPGYTTEDVPKLHYYPNLILNRMYVTSMNIIAVVYKAIHTSVLELCTNALQTESYEGINRIIETTASVMRQTDLDAAHHHEVDFISVPLVRFHGLLDEPLNLRCCFLHSAQNTKARPDLI